MEIYPYTLRNGHTAHTQISPQLTLLHSAALSAKGSSAEVFASLHIDSFVHRNIEDPNQTAWMSLESSDQFPMYTPALRSLNHVALRMPKLPRVLAV